MNILIIKFAALGDVLRTTPLLRALKARYADSHISWLTENPSASILKGNQLINKVYIYDNGLPAELKAREFDLLINLDKDKSAIALAEEIGSKQKRGFGRDNGGSLRPFDKDSEYAYRLGIDDELKFRRNKKTYQEISFEQAGLEYSGEEYLLNLDQNDVDYIGGGLKEKGLSKGVAVIGIATGCGSAFCGKSLPNGYYVKIIDGLNVIEGLQVLLLGGPREVDKNKRILAEIESKIIDTGCDNTIGQYAAIVDRCDLVLTGDTLTLHIAIALEKRAVAFFGSTAPVEIELYNRGIKLLPSIECAPCYKRECSIDEECMKQFTPDIILSHMYYLQNST